MEFIIRRRTLGLLIGTILLLISAASSATMPEKSMSEKSIPDKKTLLVYGDSLSAAYGLDIKQGWITLLQKKLNDDSLPWQVTNLSISGETSSGGLSRLPTALDGYKPDLVLLELGANDGLRGTPLKSMRGNFRHMLTLLKERDIPVLLFEMRIPPNYGPAYSKGFNRIYHELGKEFSVPVVPFFLDGVAGVPALNLPDGIHPVAEAQKILLDNVWPTLVPYLKDLPETEPKTEKAAK